MSKEVSIMLKGIAILLMLFLHLFNNLDNAMVCNNLLMIDGVPLKDRMEEVAEILALPDNVKVFSLFALGYPAEEKPQQNRFDAARIHYVKR